MIILQRILWQGRAQDIAHLLDRVIKEKLVERMAFKEKPEGTEEVRHVDI